MKVIEDPEDLSYKNMRTLFFDLLRRQGLEVVRIDLTDVGLDVNYELREKRDE